MGKYQNGQLFYECQLVALWNAARWHSLKNAPSIEERQNGAYDKAVNESSCRHGGCINIEQERKRLKLRFIKGAKSLSWIKKNLPAHLAINCHRGFHSVLVVKTKNQKVCLANYAEGRLYWLSWKTLKSKFGRPTPYSIKRGY